MNERAMGEQVGEKSMRGTESAIDDTNLFSERIRQEGRVVSKRCGWSVGKPDVVKGRNVKEYEGQAISISSTDRKC